MIRIAIVACRRIRQQNACPGDAKCLVAFMRREGEFERYKDKEAAIVGIIDCGDCHGERAPVNLGLLKTQLSALKETVDVIHVGSCVTLTCRHKDELLDYVRKKAGVEVIEGTHRYVPEKIFP